MTLKNKSIIITGASKGIGRALALLLAKSGALVSLAARSEKELLQLKSEIEDAGGQALVFAGDVADEKFVEHVISETSTLFGTVYGVVNNAGFGIFGKTENISGDDWDAVMNTNVKGTFLFAKKAIPFMRQNGEGHIINIASDVAKRVFDGGALYCASKYAQDAFSMALRKEVRRDGIKVSVVYSGLVDTHFHVHPQGSEKAQTWLKDKDMADAIKYILTAPKHVVIDELMIHPMSQDY